MFLHKTEGNYLLPNKYFNYCEHNQFKSIKLEKRVKHKIEYRYLFFFYEIQLEINTNIFYFNNRSTEIILSQTQYILLFLESTTVDRTRRKRVNEA